MRRKSRKIEEQKVKRVLYCFVMLRERKNQKHLTMLTSNLLKHRAPYVIEFQAFKNILTHTFWNETFAWEKRSEGRVHRFCIVPEAFNLKLKKSYKCFWEIIFQFSTREIRRFFMLYKVNKQNCSQNVDINMTQRTRKRWKVLESCCELAFTVVYTS